nr:RNA polymerase, subunit H/Rpb5, conserved site-containing protein [Ipomoea batatas]
MCTKLILQQLKQYNTWGSDLLTANPILSFMSRDCEVTLHSSSQLKAWSSDPIMKCSIRLANGRPTQILRPAPNGRNSKSCPLKSIFDPRNLSGLKDRGSSQLSGSRPIAPNIYKHFSVFSLPSYTLQVYPNLRPGNMSEMFGVPTTGTTPAKASKNFEALSDLGFYKSLERNRGSDLITAKPILSFMSRDCEVTLHSSSQSKAWSSDPRMKCSIRLANGRPTQILRPAPNGRNSKSCPLKSIFEPRNLSGLKDRGSSQISGSRPIAQTFTKT